MDGSAFDCSVVLAAEHDIKRLTVAVDWNLMQHVQSLFEFFLGTAKTMKQQVESRFGILEENTGHLLLERRCHTKSVQYSNTIETLPLSTKIEVGKHDIPPCHSGRVDARQPCQILILFS